MTSFFGGLCAVLYTRLLLLATVNILSKRNPDPSVIRSLLREKSIQTYQLHSQARFEPSNRPPLPPLPPSPIPFTIAPSTHQQGVPTGRTIALRSIAHLPRKKDEISSKHSFNSFFTTPQCATTNTHILRPAHTTRPALGCTPTLALYATTHCC